ncbi:MAG TPA: AAA family ATPase, partial [Thermoguttaceae bacterium]|nr:AAA family ATPase [Thermoguttaceae bacterium]
RADMTAEDDESAEKLRRLKGAIREAGLPIPPLESYPCQYAGLRINWRLARRELDDATRAALEGVAIDGIVDPQEYASIDDRLRHIVCQYGVVGLAGLETFGRYVGEQLWRAIQAEHGLPEVPPVEAAAKADPLAIEQDYHERFMESRLRVYVGRENVQERLTAFADGKATHPCLVTAPSGSGKSAALAKFAQSYAQARPDVLVIPHFVGASPGSTGLRQMLRRFCLVLKERFGLAEEVPLDVNALVSRFRGSLEGVPADGRVVLVIDALNQLDETDHAQSMWWLPWELPPGVKIIASCIDDPDRTEPVLRALAHRPVERVPIEPLTDPERREIIRQVPSLSAKTLNERQVDLLLSNPATKNPLFLLVALEELRGFGSFEQLEARITAFPRRGDTVTGLFVQVLERLEEEFTPETVKSLLPLLACSRHGLSERELLDLVEDPRVEVSGSNSDLFPILRQLRPYLQYRGDLYDFYHRNLFKAVRGRYLSRAEAVESSHNTIAEYYLRRFEADEADRRVLEDTHYYVGHLKSRSQLAIWRRLADRDFLLRRTESLSQSLSSLDALLETRSIASAAVVAAIEHRDQELGQRWLRAYDVSRHELETRALALAKRAIEMLDEPCIARILPHISDEPTRWRAMLCVAVSLHRNGREGIGKWLGMAAGTVLPQAKPADDVTVKRALAPLLARHHSHVRKLVDQHASEPGRWWLELAGWESLSPAVRTYCVRKAAPRLQGDEAHMTQLAHVVCLLPSAEARRQASEVVTQFLDQSHWTARALLALDHLARTRQTQPMLAVLHDARHLPLGKHWETEIQRKEDGTYPDKVFLEKRGAGITSSNPSGDDVPKGPFMRDRLVAFASIAEAWNTYHADHGMWPPKSIVRCAQQLVSEIPDFAIGSAYWAKLKGSSRKLRIYGLFGRVVPLAAPKRKVIQAFEASPSKPVGLPSPVTSAEVVTSSTDGLADQLLSRTNRDSQADSPASNEVPPRSPTPPVESPVPLLRYHARLCLIVLAISLPIYPLYRLALWSLERSPENGGLGGVLGSYGMFWVCYLSFELARAWDHGSDLASSDTWIARRFWARLVMAVALIAVPFLCLSPLIYQDFTGIDFSKRPLPVVVIFLFTGVAPWAAIASADLWHRAIRIRWLVKTPRAYSESDPRLSRRWKQCLESRYVQQSPDAGHFVLQQLLRSASARNEVLGEQMIDEAVWPAFESLPREHQWSVAAGRSEFPNGPIVARVAKWLHERMTQPETTMTDVQQSAFCLIRLAERFPSEASAIIEKVPVDAARAAVIKEAATALARDRQSAHRLLPHVLDHPEAARTFVLALTAET